MVERSVVSIILVFCIIGITGCVNQSGNQSEPGGSNTYADELLTNGTWKLVNADKNPQFNTLIPGTAITLTLSPDGTLSGSAGCNTYSGRWKTNENAMLFQSIGQTTMSCDPSQVMKTEKLYLALLQETATYSVTEKYLNLTGDSACTLIYMKK